MQETMQFNVFHFALFVPAPPRASHVTLDTLYNLSVVSFFLSKIIVSRIIERLNESIHLSDTFRISYPQLGNPKSFKNQKFSQKFTVNYLVANPNSRM